MKRMPIQIKIGYFWDFVYQLVRNPEYIEILEAQREDARYEALTDEQKADEAHAKIQEKRAWEASLKAKDKKLFDKIMSKYGDSPDLQKTLKNAGFEKQNWVGGKIVWIGPEWTEVYSSLNGIDPRLQ